MAALNALAVRRASGPGHYGDGARSGLYLKVGETGGKSWQFRYKRAGKTIWLGLGPERDVTLAEAREAARDCRRLLRAGVDPLAHKRAAEAARKAPQGHTFGQAAAEYIEAHRKGWKNAKHGAQWQATLDRYAAALLPKPVATISMDDVRAVLDPIWAEVPETASRVRGRIEAVLASATAKGWRTGDNPARWRGHLDQLLPARAKVRAVVHHPATPWREIGPVMAALGRSEGMAARCLAFAILTAARSGEARGARWTEIDLDAASWIIPGERMKAGKPHRVPLAPEALAILRDLAPLRRKPDDLVFPGGRAGRPLSDVALAKALRVAGGDGATPHGFRSTFRDWCAEATNYPREIAEAALAHSNRDKVEAAYQRGDHIEKRRRLMAEWAAFCSRILAAGEIVPLRAVG